MYFTILRARSGLRHAITGYCVSDRRYIARFKLFGKPLLILVLRCLRKLMYNCGKLFNRYCILYPISYLVLRNGRIA
jgi:hypothetical protein